jgi:sugar phosphate isomerase/epimerase
MQRLQILPSTTSHKGESLELTLEVFALLGMRDLDLNLHHLIEGGMRVATVRDLLRTRGQRVWIVSGGWCDFYHAEPRIDETFRSVDQQVTIARALGVDRLRLFFGRLALADYSPEALATIAGNVRRLADRYRGVSFVFENHNGASLRPEICRDILEAVDRHNVRMNFDPINFEHAGVDHMEALGVLRPLIGHVHLKGLDGEQTCEFGAGHVDLRPLLRSLIGGGYNGGFTVEYEGTSDRTLRLFEGARRAGAVVAELARSVARVDLPGS